MEYFQQAPSPSLRPFVRCLWYCAGYQAAHRFERLMPNGTSEIVISLAHENFFDWDPNSLAQPTAKRSPFLVAGVQRQQMVIDTAALEGIIGVHFQPGGAAAFLPLAQQELTGQQVDLDLLWGRDAAVSLRQELRHAPTPAAKLRRLDQCLLGRLRPNWAIAPVVGYFLEQIDAAPNVACLEALHRKTGYSVRHMTQLFRQTVGISPKQYCRTVRFRQAIEQLAASPEQSITRVAQECGYYDHAHFDHDFQAFAGISPTTYFSNRTRWAAHSAIA